MYLGFLDPEGRIFSRLRLDAAHGKILTIHPDPSTIEKLAGDSRLNRDHIGAVVRSILDLQATEVVVVGVEGVPCLILFGHGLDHR